MRMQTDTNQLKVLSLSLVDSINDSDRIKSSGPTYFADQQQPSGKLYCNPCSEAKLMGSLAPGAKPFPPRIP